ncbi:MAG: alkaline phosphatase family protein, partial [Candidatus Bathyarchaeia archaeon]
MTAFIISLDGCAPEYLDRSDIPNIKRLQRQGSYLIGDAIVPTVTNVNNVSIITGEYPEVHGIISNCYYDEVTGLEVYMESAIYIKTATVFERLHHLGVRTALLSVKDKLCTLLNRGADIAFSAEKPPFWVTERIGNAPNIYSIEANAWLLKALRLVNQEYSPQFSYVATTDYMAHKYGPDEEEAKRHMELIDDELGKLIEQVPDALLCVTADHGMSEKCKAVNLRMLLASAGVNAFVVPTVKDRYVPHHSNLSGSAYVYLLNRRQYAKALNILRDIGEVESVLPTEEAKAKYHLPLKTIGDFLVLGQEDVVFGEVHGREVRIRSHGSLHERKVPIVVNRRGSRVKQVRENKDV